MQNLKSRKKFSSCPRIAFSSILVPSELIPSIITSASVTPRKGDTDINHADCVALTLLLQTGASLLQCKAYTIDGSPPSESFYHFSPTLHSQQPFFVQQSLQKRRSSMRKCGRLICLRRPQFSYHSLTYCNVLQLWKQSAVANWIMAV